MKAFVLEKYGTALRQAELPEPTPGEGEVLVRMAASGVNHADERFRAGEFKLVFPLELPHVMGSEFAGEVVSVGAGVTGFRAGDEVYGYLNQARMGTFAELVAVDATSLALRPRSVSLVESAALPVVALTAWQALVELGGLRAGQTVLIHGGSGGVGSVAIQLARHLGARVATTVSARNADFVRELGAEIVIDYRADDLRAALAGTPVDLVLDTQGGETLMASLDVLRRGGRVIGITGPPDAAFGEQAGASAVVRLALRGISAKVRRRAKARGVNYRFLFIRPDGAALATIAGLVDEGVLRPVVDRVLDFDATPQALEQVLAGGMRGKVLVTTDPAAVTVS